MAEQLIRRACDRFGRELTKDQVQQIQSTHQLDDIKHALHQVERELAARGVLRNFGRLAPFLDAIEHYAKAIEVACNGTPFMPWIWAPIKLVVLAIQESTSCLEKMISAYGKIGQRMPRFARYAGVFPDDHNFQQLLACLFEDIIEFHRKSFEMIQKPAWKLFFAPLWGRFHSRFDELLNNISFISDQIDREAISINIAQTQESRRLEREENSRHEARIQAEQVSAVMGWLASDIVEQEDRLEWLQSRCHVGTSSWVTSHERFRSWMQLGRGNPVLWLNGKPGSGKSVISSMIVAFLKKAKRKVAYHICNYQTPPTNISAYILRSICAQVIAMMPEFVPYTYDECIANAKAPSATCLGDLLSTFLAQMTDFRLVFDGLDEVQSSEHKKVINDLMRLTKGPNSSCRILFLSQDITTIHGPLSRVPAVRLGQETVHINKDLDQVIIARLDEIDEQNDRMLGPHNIDVLRKDILARSEGMFLWVHLVMELLTNASSLAELQSEVATVPKDLTTLYIKILDRIKSCSGADFGKVRRVFSWLLCHKGGVKIPLSRQTVRVAMAIHPKRRFLTPDDVPFVHAVDICKPLIEDGPNGSLAFIHSTVAGFLIHEKSGPFMCLRDAEMTVAFACVAHLLQSFQLISDNNDTVENLLSVACFVYGFVPYAHRFWYEHLTQCADGILPEKLEQMVVELCTAYRELAPTQKDLLQSSTQPQVSESIFQGLLDADVETLKEIISHTTGNHSSSRCMNPTTTVINAHRRITRKLLSSTDVTGVSKEILLRFKDTIGPTAFTCTIFDCPRSLIGYPTEAMLHRHSSDHGPPLRCFEGCSRNDGGFTSSRSLKEHKRKFHGELLPDIPRSFRIKQARTMHTPDMPAVAGETRHNEGDEGGGQPPVPRPTEQQLSALIYQHQERNRPTSSGWQSQVSDMQRVSQTGALTRLCFVAMPKSDTNTLVELNVQFESELFLTSPDKAAYEAKVNGRIQDLLRIGQQRELGEQQLQSRTEPQADAKRDPAHSLSPWTVQNEGPGDQFALPMNDTQQQGQQLQGRADGGQPGMNAMDRQQIFQRFVASLPPQRRSQLRGMPQEKINELLNQYVNSTRQARAQQAAAATAQNGHDLQQIPSSHQFTSPWASQEPGAVASEQRPTLPLYGQQQSAMAQQQPNMLALQQQRMIQQRRQAMVAQQMGYQMGQQGDLPMGIHQAHMNQFVAMRNGAAVRRASRASPLRPWRPATTHATAAGDAANLPAAGRE